MAFDRFIISAEQAELNLRNTLKEKIGNITDIEKIVDKISEFSFGTRYHHYLNILGILDLKERNKKGCIVECGVWRGGSSMCMLLAQSVLFGKVEYPVYMLDSFESMPDPTPKDGPAALNWVDTEHFYPEKGSGISYVDDVKNNLKKLHINENDYKIVSGYFDKTMPKFASELKNPIVLLRLDADWYESTKISMKYMIPLVIDDGLIVVDDYHWVDGCAQAVHEYMAENRLSYRISNIRELTYFYKTNLKWF